jgi:putative membrane protein
MSCGHIIYGCKERKENIDVLSILCYFVESPIGRRRFAVMDFFRNLFKGLLIGIGNIAPGFSGGALAMILGIYENMLHAVSNFFKDIKKHFLYLLPIGVGAVAGIVGFSNVLKYLLNTYPMPTSFTFAGLIIGTLPVLFKRANKRGFRKSYMLPFLITLAVALSFVFIETGYSNIPMEAQGSFSISDLPALILCGFLIAGSIVIPGVSGSVMLMLFGVYGMVLEAISSVDIPVLLPLCVGLGIGVLVFTKLMEYLLKNYYGITFYAILGFVIGAIPEVITGFSWDYIGMLSIVLLFVSFIVSYWFSKFETD